MSIEAETGREDPAAQGGNPTGHIDFWRADLTQAPPLAELWGILNPFERARARAYAVPEAGRRFAASRAIVKLILSRYLERDPDEIDIRIGSRGRPRVEGDVRFSVAHAGPWLVVAVTRGREIGVDVERAQEGDGIVERWFRPEERRAYFDAPPRRKTALFARFWSRKEAVGKAVGSGLPAVLRGEVPGEWTVQDLKVAPGYAGAIALEGR